MAATRYQIIPEMIACRYRQFFVITVYQRFPLAALVIDPKLVKGIYIQCKINEYDFGNSYPRCYHQMFSTTIYGVMVLQSKKLNGNFTAKNN